MRRIGKDKTSWISLALATVLTAAWGMSAIADAPERIEQQGGDADAIIDDVSPQLLKAAANIGSAGAIDGVSPQASPNTGFDADQNDVLKAIRDEMVKVREAIAREQERQASIGTELDKKGILLTEQRARIRYKENTLLQMRRELEARFQQALENEEIRLDESLAVYWRIAGELAELRQTEQAIEAENQELSEQLARSKKVSLDLNANLDALAVREKHVLVRLAFADLRQHTSVEHGSTVKCMDTMTLRDCAELSKKTALQEGVDAFRLEVLTKLVRDLSSDRAPDTLPLEMEVVDYEILNQEFRGASTHHTKLRIELWSKPDQNLACQLVGIGSDGCSAYFSHTEKSDGRLVAAGDGATGRWAPLTVRSNVFDDEVFINGAAYGPTPLTVMLPTGQHRVEVRKQGYEAASATVSLNRGRVVRLELTEAGH